MRGEFGPDLRLIGDIDMDVLREGKESIRREKVSLIYQPGISLNLSPSHFEH